MGLLYIETVGFQGYQQNTRTPHSCTRIHCQPAKYHDSLCELEVVVSWPKEVAASSLPSLCFREKKRLHSDTTASWTVATKTPTTMHIPPGRCQRVQVHIQQAGLLIEPPALSAATVALYQYVHHLAPVMATVKQSCTHISVYYWDVDIYKNQGTELMPHIQDKRHMPCLLTSTFSHCAHCSKQ